MKELKIDFVCHALSGGGAERVMVLLAEEFAKKHRVRIITFSPAAAYSLSGAVAHIQLHHGKLKNHTLRSFYNLLSYYRKKQDRPDFCISLMPKINLIAILVCKWYGIKIIGCEHNNHLSDTGKATRFTQKYVYRLANCITVLTQFDVPFFEKHKVKVKVMPNPATFAPLKGPRTKREKAILVVGSLNRIHQKGWDNLIPIVDPVLKENSDWQLWIAGTGEKGLDLLKNDIEAYGLDDQVKFLGFRDDVDKLMGAADVFLMVSRFEGLPMVLIEAMSQGMACISYDCITGPSEIISQNKDGILIDDQNQSNMTSELLRLVESKELRKKLGSQAPKNLGKFSMDCIVRQWAQLFNEML